MAREERLKVTQWREIDCALQPEKSFHCFCEHERQIPGLDATGCPDCQVWWVDQEVRDILQPAQKGKRKKSCTDEDQIDIARSTTQSNWQFDVDLD